MDKITEFLDKLDIFAVAIPRLTLGGKKSFSTCIGRSLTVLFLSAVFAYSCVRFVYVATGHRANISSFTV